MKRGTRIVALIMLVASCLLVVESAVLAQDTEIHRGGTLIIALAGPANSLNPFRSTGASNRWVKGSLYEGLLQLGPSAELYPELAESWQRINDTTYVFHLRHGVKFHNGLEVTAQDVKFSYEYIMNPKSGAYLFSAFQAIKGIKVNDDYTITITLKYPYAPFLTYLGYQEAPVSSKVWFEEAKRELASEEMGTGPFKLESREVGVKTTLVKFNQFHVKGEPYLDKVIFVPYSDADARMNALKLKEVDFVVYPPYKDWAEIRTNPDLRLVSGKGSAMSIYYNTSVKPFNDPRVRRAIRYAINPEVIAKLVFYGEAQPFNGPMIPKGHWAYNKDLSEYFSYNPTKAKALLVQAGYPNGFHATLLCASQYAMHYKTGEIVAEQLSKVGIKVKLQLLEWSVVNQHKLLGNYEFMIQGGYALGPDPDSYSLYFGPDATFWAKPVGFNDPELSRLLEEGRVTTDRDKRKVIYHQYEERWLELSPWNRLVWRTEGFAMRSDVKGFKFILGGLDQWTYGLRWSLPTMWLDR